MCCVCVVVRLSSSTRGQSGVTNPSGLSRLSLDEFLHLQLLLLSRRLWVLPLAAAPPAGHFLWVLQIIRHDAHLPTTDRRETHRLMGHPNSNTHVFILMEMRFSDDYFGYLLVLSND